VVALVAGAGIAILCLSKLVAGKQVDFADAAALGAETTSVLAKVGAFPIHCQDVRDSAQCVAGATHRKARRSALWLGNSQLHAVNQRQKGESNAAPLLFDALSLRGLDLITMSQPNANLQEHYVLFESMRTQLSVKLLILPVVFDDMREDGLRDEVAAISRDQATALGLSRTQIGRDLVSEGKRGSVADQETAGIAQTLQERAEKGLNGWLTDHSPLWAARPQMRGDVLIALYELRNAVFGIKATTKRKVILSRYKKNFGALQATLESARREGTRMIVYVAPLRGGVEIPYDPAEYARFKSEVESLVKQNGAVFAYLEALVPDELWGTKASTTVSAGSEIDFMHFQAGGHKILAAELDRLIAGAAPVVERAQ